MRKLALVLVAVALVAGCGDAPQEKPAVAKSADKGVQFAQCMREHGIDMPDPEPGKAPMVRMTGGPGGEEKMNKAMEACRQYNPMPNGGQGNAETDARNRAFAKCMRDNGVEGFPDPEPGQLGVRIDRSVGEDPDFAKAQEACQSQLAGGKG